MEPHSDEVGQLFYVGVGNGTSLTLAINIFHVNLSTLQSSLQTHNSYHLIFNR